MAGACTRYPRPDAASRTNQLLTTNKSWVILQAMKQEVNTKSNTNPPFPKSVKFRQDEWDEIDRAAAKNGQSRHSFMRASIKRAVEEA